MKIAIHRVTRSEVYNSDPIDNELMNGYIMKDPKVGKYLDVKRVIGDYWRTTSIQKIQRKKEFSIIKTKNSTYILIKGWIK